MAVCLLLTKDLLFPSRLSVAAESQGVRLLVISQASDLAAACEADPVDMALLDLTFPGLDPVQVVSELRRLPTPPQTIAAFGPHVHASRLTRAREAGCDHVFTRGELHRHAARVFEKCC
jgi:CheY-like chemotaxis protein